MEVGMKNNIFFVLMLAVMIIWSFSSQAYAMEKRPSKKAASVKQTSRTSKTTGRVTGYNLQNSTLSISTSAGTSLVIMIDKKTSLTKGVKNIKLADIKSGDAITVSYETKKGVNIAKSIKIQEKITPTSVPKKSKK